MLLTAGECLQPEMFGPGTGSTPPPLEPVARSRGGELATHSKKWLRVTAVHDPKMSRRLALTRGQSYPNQPLVRYVAPLYRMRPTIFSERW